MLRKILCFFGWHEFTWKLKLDEPINLTINLNGIRKDATCTHCGTSYRADKGKKPEQPVAEANTFLAMDPTKKESK
jgi:hypothetical protein